MPAQDILGHSLTETESELLSLYKRLKAMSTRDDLAPCVQANVRASAVAFWQIVNDLGLEWEQPYDAGL